MSPFYLVVYFELILKDAQAYFVDLLRLLTFVLLARVHWAPFTIPDTEAMLIHPLALLLIAPTKSPLLVVAADIGLGRSGETVERVVVDRVRNVVPARVGVTEMREVGCKCVAVEEYSVLRVVRTDCTIYAVVPRDNGRMRRVCWLVQRVVARNPCVVPVVLRELLPEKDSAILEILVPPKVCDMCPCIRVPVRVLPAWCGMQVQNGVDPVLGAQVDHPIEVFKAFRLEHARIEIIYGCNGRSNVSSDVLSNLI